MQVSPGRKRGNPRYSPGNSTIFVKNGFRLESSQNVYVARVPLINRGGWGVHLDVLVYRARRNLCANNGQKIPRDVRIYRICQK